MSGYHKRTIVRGVYGEVSKIEEELEELKDAIEQKNKIMALVELSDLLGAVKAYGAALGVSLDDLVTMMEATERAFLNGHRENRDGDREPAPTLSATGPRHKSVQ